MASVDKPSEDSTGEVEGSVESKTLQARWDEVSETIESTTDRLGMPIDEGIKETVIGLNCIGLETSQSCFGHADNPGTRGPWVSVTTPELKQLFEDSTPLYKESWEHHRRTGEFLHDPQLKAYKQQTRSLVEELGAKVQPLVDEFNEVSGRHLVLDLSSSSVQITHTQGLELEPPNDLVAAQAEMTEFGRYVHDRFLAGLMRS